MDAVRWKRIKDLFDAASMRPAGERSVFLAEATGQDADLRREVQRLLDQQLNTSGLFGLVGGSPSAHRPLPRTLTGTRLGSFEITGLLGRGGMGDVYQANDTKLGRDVAIKVLPAAFTTDDARLDSFEREARVLASLNHPHIAAIHGVVEQDGTRGLVLELVDGETLADLLRRSALSNRSGLPLPDALKYACQIAEALEAAHNKGITHRDLKPANIAIAAEGVVKLLDFGIATVVGTDGTQAALVAGTPGYMSPEQARCATVDKRADIWAFGCILFEMLSCRQAFAADTLPDTITAILERNPDWSKLPRTVPRGIRHLIARCLEKDAAHRLGDIADARRALEPRLRGGSRKWIAVAAAAAGLAIAAASMALVGQRRPLGPEDWVQLTRFSDSVGQPSLSPDNRLLAFVRGASTFTTQGEIYVKTLPDGEPVQLTRDGTTKMSPAFSPDGSRVAYTVLRDGRWDTWQVPSSGGESRAWLENASGLTWGARNRLLFSEIKNADIHMGIVSALVDRTEARSVYMPAHASGMAHRSYVSPDGNWALIVEMANGPWAPCRLVSMDGHASARQVGPPNAGCTFAAWSPDGVWMYLSSSAGGGSHIWRQRFPDGVPTQITFGPTEQDGIAMAPDGRSFITAVASRQSSVWIHGPAGDRQISLEGFAFDPKFTPDGKKLMYRLLKGASLLEASELRATDLATGATESLLPDIAIYGTPSTTYAISQDGREVAVAGFDAKGECKTWMVPVDRRLPPRALPLTEAERLGLRGLSPDGRWQVSLEMRKNAVSGLTGRSVVALSRAGENELTLISPNAPTGLREMALKWSRDGGTVYFVSSGLDRGMQTKTYALPVAAGHMFPAIPTGGFRSEAELASAPGVTTYDVYDFAPGPTPNVYAFTRESVQRNLYRIPLR